jgi:two-component system, OmpR family, sensor histidine kinase MprB
VSFRARLTLAAAGAVAVAVVLASVLVYVLVSDRLHSELDASLRDRAARLTHSEHDQGIFDRVPSAILGQARGFYQYADAQGNVALPQFEAGQRPLPGDPRVRQVASGSRGQFYADQTVQGVHLRVLTVPATLFSTVPPTPIAVQIALPLTEIDSTLSRLAWILFFVALSGVGLAVILGWLVARAAVAPVGRLTTATEEITETRDLSRRVEAGSHDELGRLGTSFNTMLAALEESQQAQRQLVADASHELRTPLTSLRTNVELLALGKLPDDERTKALADVSQQLEELTVLVTDVVDLARDGEPQRVVEDVRLDLLVGDAVERARLHTPRVRFDADLHESLVQGVPDRLFRAVANVLDNAAKWSPPGGTVDVEVAHCRVTVRDQGPGIAAEDLPHVFDRFYRSPAARGTPGSGLGLAIVRQVVESHGGTVSAGAADGGGTVVRLAFPNGNGSPHSS